MESPTSRKHHEKWGTRVCETDGERRLGAGQASRLSLRGLGAAILWIKALTEGMHSVTGNSKPRAPFQDFTRAIHDLMAVPHSELWGTRQHKLPTLKPELSVVKYGTAKSRPSTTRLALRRDCNSCPDTNR